MATIDPALAALYNQVLNNAFSYADNSIAEGKLLLSNAITEANNSRWINVNFRQSFTSYPNPIQQYLKINDLPKIDSNIQSLPFLNDWLAKYNKIYNDNFSNLLSFQLAETELEKILTNGYIVNRNINNQILSRGYDNESQKRAILKDEAKIKLASMGWTIPNGILNKENERIDADYSRQISSLNREIAVKEEDLNTEMYKFAIEQALDLKIKSINVATDFSNGYGQMFNFGSENAKVYLDGLRVVNDSVRTWEKNYISYIELFLNDVDNKNKLDLEQQRLKTNTELETLRLRSSTTIEVGKLLTTLGSQALASQNSLTSIGQSV